MQTITMRPVLLLQWSCPVCKQLNSHNGKPRMTEEEEAVKDEVVSHVAAEAGVDPEDAVLLMMPVSVWCCTCGTQFEPRPDPASMGGLGGYL